MSVIDRIPEHKRESVLKMLLENYVDHLGLGTMPRADFDTLIVFTFLQHSEQEYTNFELSQIFKIKETKVKTLRELAAIKFGHLVQIDEKTIWTNIFKKMLSGILEIESVDKSQLRFHLDNPAMYRYLQKEVFSFGGSVEYKNSKVIISTQAFNKLLDCVWEQHFQNDIPLAELNDAIAEKLNNVIEINTEEVKEVTGKTKLEEKLNKSTQAISNVSNFATVVGFLQSIVGVFI